MCVYIYNEICMFQHMQIFTMIIYMYVHSVCIYVEPQRTYDPFKHLSGLRRTGS